MTTIHYHRCYVLWLNSVFGKAEDCSAVAIADTKEQLQEWEASQRADAPYRLDQYNLIYKVGSPIQWYNAPMRWDYDGGFFSPRISCR